MKPNIKLTKNGGAGAVAFVPEPTQPNDESSPSVNASIPKKFRRLKWNEMVSRGDLVANAHRQLEKLNGLTGFRAGSFVGPIYRAIKVARPRPKLK